MNSRSIENNVYDFLIVGAGLSGAVLAERFASKCNKKILIIDKRDHIAGNCYDFIDENNLLINKYGAHLFHTNLEDVWEYVNQFAEWQRWDHRVLGQIYGSFVNIPVNINTVNSLCNLNIINEYEMDEWLEKVQIRKTSVRNSKEMAESRVGKELYQKIFKYYTFKQWGKYPEELDATVLARIPVRNNFDDRYFDDRFQALPKKGYTRFTEKLLDHSNITVSLNTNFCDIQNEVKYKTLIYTGPIDQFFKNSNLGALEYRSIEFHVEHHYSMNYFQPNSVVNYLEKEIPYTRSIEYKYFLNQRSPHTTIVKERTTSIGEPYYPIFDQKNLELYGKYLELAKREQNIYFIGRLANYKYFNMDQAIKNSLDFFTNYTHIS